jgi:trigger factor
MKAEIADVSETRKHLHVEIPSDVVNQHIEQVARDYSRKARIPGFRPGKAPARVIKQRYRDQILHDVAHSLIPRAVDDALREHGIEAVDTPDIRDVNVEEGRALTFTASFETVPAFDPGDLTTISVTKPSSHVEEEAVDRALERLRDRAARYEPVEGRGVTEGDTVVLDIERRGPQGLEASPTAPPELHKDVSVELGSKANPPGFDEALLGLETGVTKTFTIHYPADHPVGELANADVSYTVTTKAIKRRVRPALDDELAKDLGEVDTLDALRARVRSDLEHEARHASERQLRDALLAALAGRLPFEAPASLVERELDRRIEAFAQRLMEQGIDPRQAGIDWERFRESQQAAAREGVAGTLVLDEVARRERIEIGEDELAREIERYAERTQRTPAAVRAALEKDGGLARVAAGLRREKSIDFIKAHARIDAT